MTIEEGFLLEHNRAQTGAETDSFTVERYRQMHSHLPPGAKDVIDVGCATGRGGVIMKQLSSSLHITGLDCVPERIAQLDKTVYQNTLCCFSTRIPVPNDSFDSIVGGEFIEHVPPNEIDATLTEFFRVLRLRGRLILTTPNPHYIKNKFRGLSVLLDKAHVTQHYPDCLKNRLRAIGYSRVKIYGSGRMIRYIGQRFPIVAVYGSYLVTADKW